MKRILRYLLFILLVVPCAIRAQTRADEAQVRQVPQAFAAAWAKHQLDARAEPGNERDYTGDCFTEVDAT
jgi:hypothetical protein